jgi:hypothetical protein
MTGAEFSEGSFPPQWGEEEDGIWGAVGWGCGRTRWIDHDVPASVRCNGNFPAGKVRYLTRLANANVVRVKGWSIRKDERLELSERGWLWAGARIRAS